MKNLLLLLLLLLLASVGNAQVNGINFEEELSWQDLTAKSKEKRKYIFVDCYASWCQPCKKMEKEVYSNDSVAKYVNANFISIKMQFDSSNKDDNYIRQWYSEAKNFKQKYKVTSFPTYLIFSPEGKIVHRDLGYKKVDDFLVVLSNAIDSNMQYYTLLKNYHDGKGNYTIMPYLAKHAQLLGDSYFADTVAQDYIDNYLLSLNEKDLYTSQNIEFISAFIKSSKQKSFNIFYKHGEKVDRLIKWKKNYSRDIVDFIITSEQILPFMNKHKDKSDPKWNTLRKSIRNKYNSIYANRNVINAKVKWYDKKDWVKYIKYAVIQIDRYGIDTLNAASVLTFNYISWRIFLYSNQKIQINKAIDWMEGVVRRNPNLAPVLDTYANLLYKAGRKKEAIFFQDRASKLAPKNREIQDAFAKMKKGEPTWSVPASDEKKN